jgi:hypothetical protein
MATRVVKVVKSTDDHHALVIEPVSAILCRTIAQLLNFLPDDDPVSKCIGYDLIDLCSDLSVLMATVTTATTSASSANQLLQHVQVEILSQTMQASGLSVDSTEYLLSIPSLDMLLFLQANVFAILQEYLQQARKKRMEDPMLVVQSHAAATTTGSGRDDLTIDEPVLEHVDACFYQILSHGDMLTSLLASIRQVLLWYDHDVMTDRKLYLLAMQSKLAAGQTLMTLLEDWEQQQHGMPSAAIAMSVRLLVVQAVESWYQAESLLRASDHKLSLDDGFRTILSHLLCHSILRPIPIEGDLSSTSPQHCNLQDEGIILCTLLQCVPLWKNYGLMELVMLRSIHTSLMFNGVESTLSNVVWSHCVSHGLLGHLFALIHNSSNNKSIANVTLWILDVLLSSQTMVDFGRCCDVAFSHHQQLLLDPDQQYATTTADIPKATTTAMDCDQPTTPVHDVTNQDNLVTTTTTSPTGRKRRRTAATKIQNVQFLPQLALQTTPTKLPSVSPANARATRSSSDAAPQKVEDLHPNEEESTNDIVRGNGAHDASCYSLNDALAHFLFDALRAASSFLDVVNDQGNAAFHAVSLAQSTSKSDLHSRLASVSGAICLLLNALVRRLQTNDEAANLLNCGSILDVLVSLCNPMKEVCRRLIVERKFGGPVLLTSMAEYITSVGLHAHFVLGQVTGTDSRLDLLRATWETFSCLGLRFWLAHTERPADSKDDNGDIPIPENEAIVESKLPAFCCNGVCQLLRERLALFDSSKCCAHATASSCLCANCFCFLLSLNSFSEKGCQSFNRFKDLNLSCSLMLLQSCPLRTR